MRFAYLRRGKGSRENGGGQAGSGDDELGHDSVCSGDSTMVGVQCHCHHHEQMDFSGLYFSI